MNLENYNFYKPAAALSDWFMNNARKLPWRDEQTPYHVWISEIMLQQTRVEAVISYYNRFIEKLPDVKALALAEEDEYLKLWEGLGYYSRVRNLHKAAEVIERDYGGNLPSSYEDLLNLPGVGSYTAGAISSLAYGKRVPAVDGNVLRVMMRLTGDSSDISGEATKKRLFSYIKEFYENPKHKNTDPRILNQALMELGALVCVPNGKPNCDHCPVKNFCTAFDEDQIETLPVKSPKKARRIEERTVLILKDDKTTALKKRPSKGLLAGLWELPNQTGYMEPFEVTAFIRQLGFSPLHIERVEDSKHIFSHVEWHMRGYRVRIEEEAFATEDQLLARKKEGIRFVNSEELKTNITMPSAFAAYRKYLI